MQVKKQQLEPDMEQQTGFKLGKECVLAVYTLLLNLYAEYTMQNAKLDKAQAGIKIPGRNINNLRYADDNTLLAESKAELKSLLIKVEEESEKAGLKLSIQKTKVIYLAWQIEQGNSGNSDRFYFLGLQNHWGQWLQPWN